MTDPPRLSLIIAIVVLSAIASAQSPTCAAYYPQYCSDGKCEAPECEIYADGSGSLLFEPGTIMAAASLPDAPSAARPPSVADRPHVSAGCGPAWLGGCWRFPNRPLADVARDPHWWAFSVGLTAATAFDYTMTAVGLSHGRCGERNPAIGQHPGAGTFAADFATTHLPVIIGGLVIGKVLPRHGPASWIYPAMASYGVQLHVRGGLSWLQGGCW